jgi:hypothetical protein
MVSCEKQIINIHRSEINKGKDIRIYNEVNITIARITQRREGKGNKSQ